jgi:hypothetical protein
MGKKVTLTNKELADKAADAKKDTKPEVVDKKKIKIKPPTDAAKTKSNNTDKKGKEEKKVVPPKSKDSKPIKKEPTLKDQNLKL